MNKIVNTNQLTQEAVSAKRIYEELGVMKDFSAWWQQQVDRLGLKDHVDFERYSPSQGENPLGGRPQIDYMVNAATALKIRGINQATHVDTVSKLAEAVAPVNKPMSELEVMVQASTLISQLQSIICDKQDELEFTRPLVSFASRVQESAGLTGVSAVAKMMDIPGLGPLNFFKWLRQEKILMSDASKWNMPYQQYIDSGYLKVKLAVRNGETHPVSMFTGKGLIWVQKQLVNGFLLIDASEEIIPCE